MCSLSGQRHFTRMRVRTRTHASDEVRHSRAVIPRVAWPRQPVWQKQTEVKPFCAGCSTTAVNDERALHGRGAEFIEACRRDIRVSQQCTRAGDARAANVIVVAIPVRPGDEKFVSVCGDGGPAANEADSRDLKKRTGAC